MSHIKLSLATYQLEGRPVVAASIHIDHGPGIELVAPQRRQRHLAPAEANALDRALSEGARAGGFAYELHHYDATIEDPAARESWRVIDQSGPELASPEAGGS